MPTGLETSIVRICRSNGVVVGAGFLVSPKHVITCAHVVADALGISRDTQKRPTEVVYLDFPLIAPEESLTGKVVFWRPVPPKGSTSVKGKEDIAGLELNGNVPEAAQPVDLIIEEDLRGHSFRTFGFPAGHDDGLEATGVICGRQGTGWIQIEDIKETGVRLESGFSGAPIWDEQLNGVVGMAVAADQKRPEAKVAFMIPTKLIATAWTALAQQTIPPLILTPDKRFRYWRNRPWMLANLVLFPILGAILFSLPQLHDKIWKGRANCLDLARQEGKQAIAIFNFYTIKGSSNISPLLETEIKDRFTLHELRNVKVCYINEIVPPSSYEDVQQKGVKAAVVIWGVRGGSTIRVFVTTVKAIVKDMTKLEVVPANSDLQTKDWDHLIYVMAAFNLSQIYDQEGRVQEAIETLRDALGLEEPSTKLNFNDKNTKEKLSKAYYFLGDLYQPKKGLNCSTSKDNCQKSIAAYQRAFDLNKSFYQPLISQAILYQKWGKLTEVEKVYTKIIESKFPDDSKWVSRTNRASVYLQQGKAIEAVKDLKIACQRQPVEPNCFRSLGLAQLEAKDIEAAIRTYQEIIRSLSNDKDAQAEVINELKSISKDNSDLLPAINKIIANLH